MMNHEEAMAVVAQGDRAQLGDLKPALNALYDRIQILERQRDAAITSKLTVAMPDNKIALAVHEILEELMFATNKFGPLKSPHEGLGVLTEEYEEIKDWVKLKEEMRLPADGRLEAKQVAAVALRFMLDCCGEKRFSKEAARTLMAA